MSLPNHIALLEQLKTLFTKARVDFNKSTLSLIKAIQSDLANKADKVHTHQASEVSFSDGEDFQTKLDNGSLKGPKGDAGAPGANGKDGAAGAKGDTGPNLVDATTSTSLNGLLKGNGSTIALAADGTDYMSKASANGAYLPKSVLITLGTAGWKDNKQTVSISSVSGEEASQGVYICPAMESLEAYMSAGIVCITQAAGSLTFKCNEKPAKDLSVYVNLHNVQAEGA